MRPILLPLLLPVVFGACASGARSATDLAAVSAASDTTLSFRIPRTIAGWRFVGRQHYDDPDLGMSVRYRHSDSLTADLYLYPGPGFDADCDVDCARALLRSEMDTNLAMFRTLEREGRYGSVSVDATRDLTPARTDRWRVGSHVRMRIAPAGSNQPHRSDLWLVYLPLVKMKVRATFLETPARTAALESFLASVVSTVTSPEPPRDERPLPSASGADDIFALLDGTWDWELSNGECEQGTHTLAASDDRKWVRLRVAGEPDSSDAHATYRVIDVGPHLLPGATHVLRLGMEGEERRAGDGSLVVWDLVFRSRDRYHWHRADWPADGMTDAVIRCDSRIRGEGPALRAR